MRPPPVVLIFPQVTVVDLELARASSNVLPVGLAYVAGALEAHGRRTHVIDMAIEGLTIAGLTKQLHRLKPAVVGVSVSTVGFPRAIEVARAVKAWRPETRVIFGGPHATAAPASALGCRDVDVAVIGEGEETMVELMGAFENGAPLDRIRGIAFRRDGQVVRTASRPFVRNLDGLASPAVWRFAPRGRLPALYDAYPICTGRGCTYACSFCAAGALAGRAYRMRSAEHVVAEMAMVHREYGVRHFFIVDDTFTAVPERAERICELLRARLPGIRWVCECRTNSVSGHLLRTMAASGCYKLQFGMESGTQEVLNRVLKGTTLPQIEQAMRLAFESGMQDVVGSFVIGLPGETYASGLNTIAFACRLRALAEECSRRLGRPCRFLPFFASLIPFPKAACTEKADALGIEILRQDTPAFISDEILTRPRGMSEKDIRELVMLAELVLQNVRLPRLRFAVDWSAWWGGRQTESAADARLGEVG